MDNWYKITLPASEVGIGGKASDLQKAFEVVFLKHAAPLDAALFSNYDENFENHFFYFSPDAFQIARPLIESLGGVACSAPMLSDDVHLLVGHSGAREALLRPAK